MKENNKTKIPFSRSSLWIITLYIGLWIVQLYCRQAVSPELNAELYNTLGAWFRSCSKSNIPFPMGWCLLLEWLIPLALCMEYVILRRGYNRLYYVINAIVISGVIEICCGTYGLKQYTYGGNVFFSLKSSYWYCADFYLGKYLPLYFAGWCLGALLFSVSAPKLLKTVGKSKRYFGIGLTVLWLFCLCEGILFNMVYFGEYTVFFVGRNILLLLFLVLSFRQIEHKDFADGSTENQNNSTITEENISGRSQAWIIFLVLCLLGHVCIWGTELALVYDGAVKSHEISIYQVLFIQFPQLVYRNFSVFLTLIGSWYVVKSKPKAENAQGVAVLTGMAFLVEEYLRSYAVAIVGEKAVIAAVKVGLTAWCIILYLVFIWLSGKRKQTDIIFVVMLYGAAMTGTYMECFAVDKPESLPWCGVMSLILYTGMFGITIWKIARDKYQEKSRLMNRKGLKIWILIVCYAIFAVCDGEVYSALILLVVITYLAYAFKKEEMQIFCSTAAFSTMFYLNLSENDYSDIFKVYNGVPALILGVMLLLFLFPLFVQMFPQKEIILRRIFLLITYAVFLYEYIGPFVINWGKYTDSGHEHGYRYPTYIVAMASLVVLGIVTFLGEGGLKQNADRREV